MTYRPGHKITVTIPAENSERLADALPFASPEDGVAMLVREALDARGGKTLGGVACSGYHEGGYVGSIETPGTVSGYVMEPGAMPQDEGLSLNSIDNIDRLEADMHTLLEMRHGLIGAETGTPEHEQLGALTGAADLMQKIVTMRRADDAGVTDGEG